MLYQGLERGKAVFLTSGFEFKNNMGISQDLIMRNGKSGCRSNARGIRGPAWVAKTIGLTGLQVTTRVAEKHG